MRTQVIRLRAIPQQAVLHLMAPLRGNNLLAALHRETQTMAILRLVVLLPTPAPLFPVAQSLEVRHPEPFLNLWHGAGNFLRITLSMQDC